jgi:hypothetical protein
MSSPRAHGDGFVAGITRQGATWQEPGEDDDRQPVVPQESADDQDPRKVSSTPLRVPPF